MYFLFLQLWGCPGWIHTWMCFQRKSWGAILVSLRGYHCKISNCFECIWQFYHLFGYGVHVSSNIFQADCFSGQKVSSKELIILVRFPHHRKIPKLDFGFRSTFRVTFVSNRTLQWERNSVKGINNNSLIATPTSWLVQILKIRLLQLDQDWPLTGPVLTWPEVHSSTNAKGPSPWIWRSCPSSAKRIILPGE